MYGLALQNGWGIEQNMEEGFRYLQIAAYNSALIQKNASTEDEKKPAKRAMNHALYEVCHFNLRFPTSELMRSRWETLICTDGVSKRAGVRP
jgi:hypothetical protein